MAGEAERLAEWLSAAKNAVAFTGAGISTESGIPDFRSPGGVWSKYRTVDYSEFLASAPARDEYWRQKAEAHGDLAAARPNRGHDVLAAWERRRLLRGVITQNIDGLHQQAGSRAVLELHGTARDGSCLDCGWRAAIEPFLEEFGRTGRAPACPRCGGRFKHATVSFGQALPTEAFAEAMRWAVEAPLMLAIGSSLVVTPAADLPRLVVQRGGRLAILNRDPTPLDSLASLVIRAPIGATLAMVAETCRG